MNESPPGPLVGVFVTCLVDLVRPTVALATVRLLEQAGCRVFVPGRQTCCGQGAFNAGARADAQALARQVITQFADVDHVVVPSGSCAAMIRVHYPELLADDPEWADRARALAARTWELTAFLTDVLNWDAVDSRFDETVTYHDSCSGRRELGIVDQPRRLLARVEGLTLREIAPEPAQECCGFGGTFSTTFPEVSQRLAHDKLADVLATGATTLLGADLGCLVTLAAAAQRQNAPVRVRHVAEVLAGLTDGPAVGEISPAPGP
ncbi:(Fe-S)-binding protein [Pararhodospirillum oryzae]|uniref:Fe-S oxidoreductase n=1 Tax=Pararhodospirillum oryzae TaxID=478448 RepID=A0A512H5X8_9PROT|nr:(Fe-S)-binding protein [Pararhodospirillum oryzae]GEO80876.1 Fe-S oxidoreductase [Pararhodospirillum oryzae]